MKDRLNLLHIAALIIAAILLLSHLTSAQDDPRPIYRSEPFVRELGLQMGKLPLSAAGLQKAVQSLGDSGVVLISYPGVWDTTGVGAIPEGINIKGWLFGQEVGVVNIDIDDSTGIAQYVAEALIPYATIEFVEQGFLTDEQLSDFIQAYNYATQTDLSTGLSGKANTSHTHSISDVTGLQGALDGKSDTTHTHVTFTSDAAGFVPASGGGTSNYLRADGTWAAPPGGGGGDLTEEDVDNMIAAFWEALPRDSSDFTTLQLDSVINFIRTLFSAGVTGQMLYKLSDDPYDVGWDDAPSGGGGDATWGSITGTLSSQTDLNNALGAKEDTTNKATDLTSPDNTKYPTTLAVSTALSGKQDALGFTPENISNKATNLSDPDNTKYPTTLAVSTALETILNEGDPRVLYMWVNMELDTIPDMTEFTPATDVEISTQITSDSIDVSEYDVTYFALFKGGTDAEYRTKRSETWSDWSDEWQMLKAVEHAEVRFTSSDEYETALACTLYAGGVLRIFTATTIAEAEPELPDAPTDFIAVGGTSETEIPMTWTDAEGDIDSVRVYEGSTNDTTAFVWIASVAQGTEAYNRTGREANTSYWYSVKSYDGSNESYFAPPDSATTLAGSADTLGTNILINGDFESALGENWEVPFSGSIARQEDTVYAGDYALRFVGVDDGTGVMAYTNGYSVYELEPSTTYYLTGYVYIVSGAGNMYVDVQGVIGDLVITTKDEWVEFSYGFTTGIADPFETRPGFWQTGNDPTTFYLDNVQLRELLE